MKHPMIRLKEMKMEEVFPYRLGLNAGLILYDLQHSPLTDSIGFTEYLLDYIITDELCEAGY